MRRCELCRDMLPEMLDAEKQYEGKINFVALNVENTKWAPEMLEFNVDGIPHYVFLDADQKPQAVGVGRLPKKVLEGTTRLVCCAQWHQSLCFDEDHSDHSLKSF